MNAAARILSIPLRWRHSVRNVPVFVKDIQYAMTHQYMAGVQKMPLGRIWFRFNLQIEKSVILKQKITVVYNNIL